MESTKLYLKAAGLSSVREGAKKAVENKPTEAMRYYLQAVANYREYLDANAKDDDAWACLGGDYRRLEDVEQSLDSYRKAYDINPESTYALVNLVCLSAARNSKEDKENLESLAPEAIRLCQKAVASPKESEGAEQKKPNHWAFYDLATMLLIQGDEEKSLETFRYAAELTPRDAKENYRSVLSNLEFIRERNPSLPGITKVISLIKKYESQPCE